MNRSCGACLVSSLFLGICLAQSSVPISQPIAASDPIARDFEKLIAELMASQGIPAIGVAITDAGGTLWARGFGITHYARRLPVTPETTFSIQSISKTFTATAVMSILVTVTVLNFPFLADGGWPDPTPVMALPWIIP